MIVLLVAAVAVATVLVGLASATKPGPGGSTGVGSVFVSNPVQSLGDESLTDQKDADAAVPAAAYYNVTLTNLDGSGFLDGDYATVVSETGNAAYSPTNSFLYTRSQDEFEQVMAYYWVTEAQKYIQGLGFGVSRRPIDDEPQRRADQPARATTTHSRPIITSRAALRKGRGRRRRGRRGDPPRVRPRDPLVAELLVRIREAGAISEGFGDYWAVTVANVVARQLGVPSWSRFRASRTGMRLVHEERAALPPASRLDLHYPGGSERRGAPRRPDLVARALGHPPALGNVKADTVILQGSFDFPGTTMPDLAQRTVDAAQQLYGNAARNVVHRAFVDSGILS